MELILKVDIDLTSDSCIVSKVFDAECDVINFHIEDVQLILTEDQFEDIFRTMERFRDGHQMQ